MDDPNPEVRPKHGKSLADRMIGEIAMKRQCVRRAETKGAGQVSDKFRSAGS
jgi:hypothetical protein